MILSNILVPKLSFYNNAICIIIFLITSRPIWVIEYNRMLNYFFPKSCKKKFHYIERLYMEKSLNHKSEVWKEGSVKKVDFFFPALKTTHKCSKSGKWFGPARTPGTPGTKGPRSRGPGRTGPRDLEGPVVLPGQDLETLKVLGTWRLEKSRDNGKPSFARDERTRHNAMKEKKAGYGVEGGFMKIY